MTAKPSLWAGSWWEPWFSLQSLGYRHLPFTAAFAVGVALVLPKGVQRPLFVAAAVVLVAGVQLVASLVAWPPMPRRALVVLPLVQMLALVALEFGTTAAVRFDTVLLFLPVLNLGLQPGWSKLWIATAGAAMVVALPLLFEREEANAYSVAVNVGVTALVALFVAAGAAGVTEVLRRRTQALVDLEAEQERTLAEFRENHAELARTTESLQESIDLAYGLIESATEHAIITTDHTGIIETFNRGAESMLAYARSEIIGRHVEVLYDPEELAAVFTDGGLDSHTPEARSAILAGEAASGHPTTRDWNFVRGDGGRVLVEVVITLRPSLSLEHPGYLYVCTDLTKRREAERQQEEFIGLVSHELRTPLVSVLGYLELLESEGLTGEQVEYLGVIERNAQRLLRLVNDLLLAVRLSAGTFTLSLEEVDVSASVSASAFAILPAALAAEVELIVEAQTDLKIRADGQRLSQAVENLLTNAVKFTPKGGTVTVTVRDGEIGDNERAALVAVTDTGIGIAPEELGRLTERFYRVGTPRNQRIGGIGLGLPIVKAIADAHNGTLRVESVLGEGSTFTLTLPMSGPPEPSD
jgi:PAS domain S-box-containing protein